MDGNSTYYNRCDRGRGVIPGLECGSARVDCRSIAYDSLCFSHHCLQQHPLRLLQIPGSICPNPKQVLFGSCEAVLRLAFLTSTDTFSITNWTFP